MANAKTKTTNVIFLPKLHDFDNNTELKIKAEI